ncbi:MAG TPA: phage tail protein, partial [Candidatus Saccharimonadales bacterium]
MSNGYGVDIYGEEFYGYSQSVDYSVAPFVAAQTGYGEITLTWASPNVTSWKLLHLVRSIYGYPTTAADGVLLQEIVPGAPLRSYDDAGLVPGKIYYYSMFITVEAPTWASGTSYLLNAQVLYQGLYYTSTANGNTGNTPAAGSAFWSPTQYIPTWFPAGSTATLAVTNQGYGQLLYNRTPQPYKIVTSDTFTNTDIDNPSLQNYLSLFGFGLDMLKGSYDSYLKLNDPDTVSAYYLDILGQQLGLDTDYLSTPQQRRQRVKNATVNYRLKGTTPSIHNLIAELTGWDTDISYGPNMLNSADQTAFVHPKYDVWNVNTTYFVGNPVQYNGYNYKCLVQAVGQAQAPTGTNSSNTNWQVQLQILDTTVNKNPKTATQTLWSIRDGVDATAASITGVLTGLPHPTDTTINNWNALEVLQTSHFNPGLYSLASVEDYYTTIDTPSFSTGADYVINNYVLGTDGYYYRAVKPSGPDTPHGVITPGTNNQFWKAFYFDPSLDEVTQLTKDAVPLPQLQNWNPTTAYTKGEQVQSFGILYEAAQDSVNQAPSNNYYSNSYWIFLSTIQETIVVSAAWAEIASGSIANSSVTSNVVFYDDNNNQIVFDSVEGGTQGLVARFTNDYADMAGSSEPSLANAVSGAVISGGSWVSTPTTPFMWRTSYGMASVNQSLAGTTKYVYTIIPTGQSQGMVAVTFASDYIDTAHKTHGIIFGWQDSSNFFYATRTSLWQVVAGTETLRASWTRLVDGDRMLIDVGSEID